MELLSPSRPCATDVIVQSIAATIASRLMWRCIVVSVGNDFLDLGKNWDDKTLSDFNFYDNPEHHLPK